MAIPIPLSATSSSHSPRTFSSACLTALVCFRFLRQLGFAVNHCVAGVLALLLATTHLHYTQNMMENNYIFLLTLTGFSFEWDWLRTGSRRALLIGAAAFGLNLLTRLTTGLDLLAGMIFVLLVLWFEGVRGRALWERISRLWLHRSPCLLLLRPARPALSVLSLRILHQHLRRCGRTGGIATPYRLGPDPIHSKHRSTSAFSAHSLLPRSPSSSSIRSWSWLSCSCSFAGSVCRLRSAPTALRHASCCSRTSASTLVTRCGAATSHGAIATSRRQSSLSHSLPFPCCSGIARDVGKTMFAFGVVLLAVSTAIQIASLAFWLPLEIYQMETLGTSDIRHRSSLQKHPCVRTGKDGCMGTQQPRNDRRPVGLCPHHLLELPAIPAP